MPRTHDCIDCRKRPELPTDPADVLPDVVYRPKTPRSIAPGCGPRSQRCTTHKRAHERGGKDRVRATNRLRKYGLTEISREEVIAEQGGVCEICQRGLDRDPVTGRQRRSATDHNHECCPQPPTCGDCTRGIPCGHCNGKLLGLLATMPGGELAAARRLVRYLEDPPMARVRRRRAMTQMRSA